MPRSLRIDDYVSLILAHCAFLKPAHCAHEKPVKTAVTYNLPKTHYTYEVYNIMVNNCFFLELK